jgi:GNAT superfamily N-acetyltransferase
MDSVKTVSIRYQKALISDVLFLLTLRKQTMTAYLVDAGFPNSDEYHLERIHEFFDDSLIIYLNEERIGLLKVAKNFDAIHIRQFQVLSIWQNKGIGQQVLSTLKNKARHLNISITLNVLMNNPAKRLYQRCGFNIIGQTHIEYQMQWRDDNTE